MHSHSTNGDDFDWQWGAPAHGNSHPTTYPLTLLLTRRLSGMLNAVAHDLELPPDEAALLLLRDTLWRHYHLMQHI